MDKRIGLRPKRTSRRPSGSVLSNGDGAVRRLRRRRAGAVPSVAQSQHTVSMHLVHRGEPRGVETRGPRQLLAIAPVVTGREEMLDSGDTEQRAAGNPPSIAITERPVFAHLEIY